MLRDQLGFEELTDWLVPNVSSTMGPTGLRSWLVPNAEGALCVFDSSERVKKNEPQGNGEQNIRNILSQDTQNEKPWYFDFRIW